VPAPLRVMAYTGGQNVSSARFRVRQYVSPLAQWGIDIQEKWPAFTAYPPRAQVLRPAWFAATVAQRLVQISASRECDVVLFQKELVSTLPTVEKLARRPCLVDVDDAIHLFRGGWAARRLAAVADRVIVGNEWLAEIWRQWVSEIEVLPTAIDTNKYKPTPRPPTPVIGWIGLGSNLHYLAAIAPALAKVVERFPETRVAVCSDAEPDLPGLPVSYVPWSSDAEQPFLASISIGVMPLADGPWERGKCAFKMLQYMAAGRPCVVSPAFMNAQILRQAEVGLAAATLDDWVDALCGLIRDDDAAKKMGDAGRKLAAKAYSVEALAPSFAAQLRRLA
jgi:glycosyltransferase involved in cell wall biosynthesis